MEFFEPRISCDTAEFWAGCKEHKLIFRKCSNCGKVIWPAGYLCPDCLCEKSESVELAPEGALYSYVVMHKPFHPSLADKVPYVVAAVDLADGVRIIANILDCDIERLRCGDSVVIDFADAETYSRPIAHIKGE